MKKTIISLAAALLCLCSCNKILDKSPQSKISPGDFFSSETELQLYTNPLYDLFDNSLIYRMASTDKFNDHIIEGSMTDEQAGTRSAVQTSWSWTSLRRINSLLANAKNCEDAKVRAKYEGLARFFRAYFYFIKVKKWGDVPWVDRELESDDEKLYAPRDTRETVMKHMLEDLDFAIENLPEGVSTYRVNKWAALAFKAQVCLFEGTFRKYHNATGSDAKGTVIDGRAVEGTFVQYEHDADYYLDLAAKAAKEVMESGLYSLAPNYLRLFAGADSDVSEYILATKYDKPLGLMHGSTSYAVMPTQGRPGLTKKFVDSYLMKDGTRFTDKEGWATMEFKDELADRDPRLSYTTRVPGYIRIGKKEVEPSQMSCSVTGYQLVKFVMDGSIDGIDRVDFAFCDLPVFRLGEVYLIYAEALAELGTLTQADLDISLNLLRKRVGMPSLDMAAANADPDDNYMGSAEYGYTNVEGGNRGVILEIRRERSIELAQEGLRSYDILRWKAGKCVEQAIRGPYFPRLGGYDLTGDGKINLYIYDGAKPTGLDTGVDLRKVGESGTGIYLTEDGYCEPYQAQRNQGIVPTFVEPRDYFYPIPAEEILLNQNLTQNAGW